MVVENPRLPAIPCSPFVAKEYGSVRSLLTFCERLPKVELHAHLNGSIEPETLRQLAENKLHDETSNKQEAAKGALQILDAIAWKTEFDIKDFFPLFKHIYALTNDEASLTFITREVIKDFENDGVKYLELRSTPRESEVTGLTKEKYVQTLLNAIATSCNDNIRVKLILSIDRKYTADIASHIVDLAIKYQDRGVIGVDFSGDPHQPNDNFDSVAKQAMKKAKAAGLKVTLHLGEIPGRTDENQSMLSILPDRLGHATFMSDEIRAKVYVKQIPIEICMTSNLLTKTVSSYDVHHIKDSLENNHPCVLCTDDKGIMACTLSYEYALAASTFSMTKEQLYDLSVVGINATFADECEKQAMRDMWDGWAETVFGKFRAN